MIALLIGAYGSEYLTGKKPLSPGILLPAYLAALSALGFGAGAVLIHNVAKVVRREANVEEGPVRPSG